MTHTEAIVGVQTSVMEGMNWGMSAAKGMIAILIAVVVVAAMVKKIV